MSGHDGTDFVREHAKQQRIVLQFSFSILHIGHGSRYERIDERISG